MTRVTSIRVLGVIIESNLSFSLHVNIVIKKAFKMLGFINRSTSNFKNINSFKTLYFSLVRFHLEFGSIVWSSNYSFIQKYILKMFNINSLNYYVIN